MASCTKAKFRKDEYEFINYHEEDFYLHKSDMKCVAANPCKVLQKMIKDDEVKRKIYDSL